MSRAAVSAIAWGIYLSCLGLLMAVLPDVFTSLLRFAPAEDFWLQMAGALVVAIGYLYVRAAQGEVRAFFRWSIEVRPVVFLICILFPLLGKTQWSLALFGVLDLVGAGWMLWALSKDEQPRG
jgi:hypothetical protein